MSKRDIDEFDIDSDLEEQESKKKKLDDQEEKHDDELDELDDEEDKLDDEEDKLDDDEEENGPTPNSTQNEQESDDAPKGADDASADHYFVTVHSRVGNKTSTTTFEGDFFETKEPCESVSGVGLTSAMIGDAKVSITLNRSPNDDRPTGLDFFKKLFEKEPVTVDFQTSSSILGYQVHFTDGIKLNHANLDHYGQVSFKFTDWEGTVGELCFMVGGGCLLFALKLDDDEWGSVLVIPPPGRQLSWKKSPAGLELTGKI